MSLREARRTKAIVCVNQIYKLLQEIEVNVIFSVKLTRNHFQPLKIKNLNAGFNFAKHGTKSYISSAGIFNFFGLSL